MRLPKECKLCQCDVSIFFKAQYWASIISTSGTGFRFAQWLQFGSDEVIVDAVFPLQPWSFNGRMSEQKIVQVSYQIQVTLLTVISSYKGSLFNHISGILILFSSCSNSHLGHTALQIRHIFKGQHRKHKSTMNAAYWISCDPICSSHRLLPA